jgi:8-oxo-dGTP pyrophosphatase MutT (NUDIX family)
MARQIAYTESIKRVMDLLYERSCSGRLFRWNIENPEDASAVLFLLGEHCGGRMLRTEQCVVLTKRSIKVRQPGDLCFPGGRVAPRRDHLLSKILALPLFPMARWPYWSAWRHSRKDAGHLACLFATSLRESMEEIWLNPFGVRFLGPLPPEKLELFSRIIYPMVAWIGRQRRFLINWEVERMVYIPIRDFFNTERYACYRISMEQRVEDGTGQETKDFPCFRHWSSEGTEALWGATYRIVMGFLELVYGFRAPEPESLPVIYGRLDRQYFFAEGRQFKRKRHEAKKDAV